MASAACLTSSLPSLNNVFSPIALFECTISNAQMLVESMELVDLILAQKIVCQLQGRLVEVMEPSAGRLAQIAQLYNSSNQRHGQSESEQPCQHLPTEPEQSEEHQKLPEKLQIEHNPATTWQSSTGVVKAEAGDVAAPAGYLTDREAAAGDVSIFNSKANEPELDAEASQDFNDGISGMLWADTANASVGIATNWNRSQLIRSTGSANTKASTGVGGASGIGGLGGTLSDRWKQLLRRSYRSIKDLRGELFDFTKSYSAPVNRNAARAIIDRAIAMTSQPPPDVESWKNSVPVDTFMRYWFKDILRRNYRRQHQPKQGWASRAARKLSQRQRSYDNLQAHGTLGITDMARLRALLDLQYTSSDDEVAAADDDAAGFAADGEPQTVLRVKRLAWESAEASRLKALLDQHFAEVIANPRERLELERIRRHPDWISRRPKPDSPLAWAVIGCGAPNSTDSDI